MALARGRGHAASPATPAAQHGHRASTPACPISCSPWWIEPGGLAGIDRLAAERRTEQQVPHPAPDGVPLVTELLELLLDPRVASVARGVAGQGPGRGLQHVEPERADRRLDLGVDPAQRQQGGRFSRIPAGSVAGVKISLSTRPSGA